MSSIGFNSLDAGNEQRRTARLHGRSSLLVDTRMVKSVRSHASDYQYPFNHSTYYTRNENDPYTSELPPMNSEEDVLQEHLMNHRQFGRSSYLWPDGNVKRKRATKLKRLFRKLKRSIERSYWGIADKLRGR